MVRDAEAHAADDKLKKDLLECAQCELKFKEQGHLDRHVHDYHETEEGSLRDR